MKSKLYLCFAAVALVGVLVPLQLFGQTGPTASSTPRYTVVDVGTLAGSSVLRWASTIAGGPPESPTWPGIRKLTPASIEMGS
jgi:hypothetical protein